jgi:hypothetical protein
MGFRATATADSRYSLTASFLHAAAMFANRADAIEAAITARANLIGDLIDEHRGCVAAAVMESVAALEAEIYEVIVHGPGHHRGSNHVDLQGRDRLKSINLKRRARVVERYASVLKRLGKQPISRNDPLWEQAGLLVDFRDELSHYKSRWASEMKKSSETDSNDLVARLKALQLARPSFSTEHERNFPQRYLSAAYAAWGVKASMTFLLEFYQLLGHPAPIAPIESKVLNLLHPRMRQPIAD